MIKQLPGHPGAIWEVVEDNPEVGLIIDLGAGSKPLSTATTIVDLFPPPEDFGGEFIRHDLCDLRWADKYPDKYFDFVFCNHLLEDCRDPIGVLRVATRIAKRGMFGTPHWTYEAGVRGERDEWEAISGWPHHRWLVGINKITGAYEFFPKLCWFVKGEYQEARANLNLEWDGGEFHFADITYEYPDRSRRADLLDWLEERWMR